jgi:glycosyltransferase involved in cell wall biosynthesis
MTATGCSVSVVLSTANRGPLLGAAIDRLLHQRPGTPSYEVIVVDNDSTDDTRAIVTRRQAGSGGRLRYVFEPRPGLSHARNAGIAAALGDVVAFTDDDVRVADHWVDVIKHTFDAHPDVDCLGGRTLPIWPAEPPAWLTRRHWVGPLALQEYGDENLLIDARHARCLAGANLAFRRRVFSRIGLFALDYPRSQDTEFMLRYWRAGGRALYVPAMLLHAEVQPERLMKAYHRRWHARVGQSNARMGIEELTDAGGAIRIALPQVRRVWGVPRFAVRLLLQEAWSWLREALRGDRPKTFSHELQFRALVGYVQESRALFVAQRRVQRQAGSPLEPRAQTPSPR